MKTILDQLCESDLRNLLADVAGHLPTDARRRLVEEILDSLEEEANRCDEDRGLQSRLALALLFVTLAG